MYCLTYPTLIWRLSRYFWKVDLSHFRTERPLYSHWFMMVLEHRAWGRCTQKYNRRWSRYDKPNMHNKFSMQSSRSSCFHFAFYVQQLIHNVWKFANSSPRRERDEDIRLGLAETRRKHRENVWLMAIRNCAVRIARALFNFIWIYCRANDDVHPLELFPVCLCMHVPRISYRCENMRNCERMRCKQSSGVGGWVTGGK